jgi:HK97 family phage major capsid protein
LKQKITYLIGALLFVALLLTFLSKSVGLHFVALHSVVFACSVMALGLTGTVLIPEAATRSKTAKGRILAVARFACMACAALAVLAVIKVVIPMTAAMGVVCAVGPGAIPEEDLEEFRETIRGLKRYGTTLKDLPDTLRRLTSDNESLSKEVNRLKKGALGALGGVGRSGITWIGNKPFVTDDCAQAITAAFVVDCARLGEKGLASLIPNEGRREPIFQHACSILAMETRTAMTGTELPLPTVYIPQVVELVYLYGQARQYATVYPLGPGTNKLPRLKAGEDDFGYLGAGTAGGLSQTVNEKRAAAELVTFDPSKFGGIIRIPFELETDTFIQIGQFLARYIARQFAKMEDKTLFLADGTSTYGNQVGIAKYCDNNPTYRLQLGAGNVNPSDATLDDWRNLRGLVSAGILAGGFDAAYYINPTFEPKLRSFNKYPNFVVFERDQNGKAMFDGWPVRWIGVSQAFQTTAAPNAYIGFFGCLPYWYLGERGQPRVEVSRDVYFTTDEIAMRALERIDVEAMAVDAMATLKTAAA